MATTTVGREMIRGSVSWASCLFAVLGACAEEPIPKDLDELMRQGEAYLDPETMRPYTGPVFARAEDDSMRVDRSGFLLNGRLEGVSESYHANGRLWERATYVAGVLTGPAEYFEESGQPASSGRYDDNLRCGEWVTHRLGLDSLRLAFPEYDDMWNSELRVAFVDNWDDLRRDSIAERMGDSIAALPRAEFEAFLDSRFTVTESYEPCVR